MQFLTKEDREAFSRQLAAMPVRDSMVALAILHLAESNHEIADAIDGLTGAVRDGEIGDNIAGAISELATAVTSIAGQPTA